MKNVLYRLITLLLIATLSYGCASEEKPPQKEKSNNTSLLTTPSAPARPSRPVPAPVELVAKSPVTTSFETNTQLESLVASAIKSTLFDFSFETPGEMAAPRPLLFSGTVESEVAQITFPAFQLWLFDHQATAFDSVTAVYTATVELEKETMNVYSFQLQMEESPEPGLYYYFLRDEDGRTYAGQKLIVDY